jgi:hypothetical protein
MIIVLSAAFALVEEGLTTQSLFNPDYTDADLLEHVPIPALGVGAWWTIFVVALHIMSLCISIALVEGLGPERASTAWLGRRGLATAIGLLVLGVVVTTAITIVEDPYVAEPAQLIGVTVAAALVVAAAWRRSGRSTGLGAGSSGPDLTPAPTPGQAGLITGALVATYFSSIVTLEVAPWASLAIEVVALALLASALHRWSRRSGWTLAHVGAAATGAAAAYACFGLLSPPVVATTVAVDLVGNALVAAAVLMVFEN